MKVFHVYNEFGSSPLFIMASSLSLCFSLCPHLLLTVSVSVTPSADLLLGSEATLQCDVKGLIEGCEVKWRSPNVDSPEWSPTAQLKPVTSSHNGIWQCIITCGSNQLSEHLTITVQGNTQILEMKTPVFHCDQKKNKRVFSFPEPPPTTSTTTASLCSPKTTFAIVCSVLLSYFLLWLINNCFYVKLCSYVFIMNFLSFFLILHNYIKRGKIYSKLRAQPTF